MIDRVLAPLRPGTRSDAHERLLARITVEAPIGILARDDPLGVGEKELEPLTRAGAGATRKVVARVLAPIDVDLSFGWPRAWGELNQSLGLAVQEAELQCPVLARWQGARERPAVREPNPHRETHVLPGASLRTPACQSAFPARRPRQCAERIGHRSLLANPLDALSSLVASRGDHLLASREERRDVAFALSHERLALFGRRRVIDGRLRSRGLSLGER